MAYKVRLGHAKMSGSLGTDDITYSEDPDTGIDFEADTIKLETGGAERLVVTNNGVGIGNNNPSTLLHLEGTDPTITFSENNTQKATIGVNSSDNILFQNFATNKHIVFKVNDQGTVREALRVDGAVSEVVVNQGSESLVDFRVESDNNTHMLFVDGSEDRVGIGTQQPNYTLHVAGEIGVDQYIRHNGDPNTHINFTDDKIVLKAGNISMVTMEQKNTAPHEVTVNDGGNNIDFIVENNSGNTIFRTDASTSNVGIGTDQPETALDINASAMRLRNSSTPSSATDYGHPGEIRWDANYIYVCVATDTWKRVALSSW